MEKVTPVEIDGKVIYEDANIKQLSDELRMVTGIFEYFDALKTGSLEVPEDQVIDYSFTAVKRTISGDRNIDLDKDEPLFAHEPTPDDIVQGDLGDCYFMSALASMAKETSQLTRKT